MVLNRFWPRNVKAGVCVGVHHRKRATPKAGAWRSLGAWYLTEHPVFALWNIPCILFIDVKLIKVHFLALLWLFGHWMSQNSLKWTSRPPCGPQPPQQIRQFWVNGSKFSNSVKRRWKYTKFAIIITKNLDFSWFWPGPPPTPLM